MPADPVFLATAIEAAIRAGETQLAFLDRSVHVDKKGVIDLVTDADIAVEVAFRTLIADRFPDHQIVGEELSGLRQQAAARYCWFVDPIDGTTNYAHGLPIFCSSVALQIDGRTEVAAIHDPNRSELFTAERGDGARLNGRRLAVSKATVLLDSLLCTGFPYDVHETLDEVIGLFGEFVGRVRAVRRLGSAALDLAYVAAGRLDGFWEQRLKPWDTAAGALIVEEAGGSVTTWEGAPFDPHGGYIVASNGVIHAAMLETIRGFSQRRSGNRTD